MPTIRVDDDVYEALRNRGKTGDSFSDVLRPLLRLGKKKAKDRVAQAVAAEPGTKAIRKMINSGGDKQAYGEFVEVISRHLPAHWRDSTMRFKQIAFVVATFLNQPANLSSAERHSKAAKIVAKQFGVEVTTVHDKCGRQLYGTGTPDQFGRFRRALELVESDWRKRGATSGKR